MNLKNLIEQKIGHILKQLFDRFYSLFSCDGLKQFLSPRKPFGYN